VSRTGRTEYQLLLMKAFDRGQNVKFLVNLFSEYDRLFIGVVHFGPEHYDLEL